jgi:hypothetical protein
VADARSYVLVYDYESMCVAKVPETLVWAQPG